MHLSIFFLFLWHIVRTSLSLECPFWGDWTRECSFLQHPIRIERGSSFRTAIRWSVVRRNWFCRRTRSRLDRWRSINNLFRMRVNGNQRL